MSTHPQSNLSEPEPGCCLFVVGLLLLLSWLACKPQWFSCLQFPIGLELRSHAQLFHMGPGDLNLLPLPTESFPQFMATFGISDVRHTLPSKSEGVLTEWCFPICKDLISLLLWGRWFFFSAIGICSRSLENLEMSWLPSEGPELTPESFHFKLIGFSKIFHHSALVFCFFKSRVSDNPHKSLLSCLLVTFLFEYGWSWAFEICFSCRLKLDRERKCIVFPLDANLQSHDTNFEPLFHNASPFHAKAQPPGPAGAPETCTIKCVYIAPMWYSI